MGAVDFEHQAAFLQEKLLAEDGYFNRKKKESARGQAAADRKESATDACGETGTLIAKEA